MTFPISSQQAREIVRVSMEHRRSIGVHYKAGVEEEMTSALMYACSKHQAIDVMEKVMDTYEITVRFPWHGARTLRSVMHA